MTPRLVDNDSFDGVESGLVKKVALVLAGLLVLLLAVALAAPSFVDWNAYRGDVELAVQEATGRSLAIDGDLDLAILPTPHLRATGLRFASAGDAKSADLLRAAELRLKIGIRPLLRGRLVVTSLVLVEPEVALEKTASGQYSWDIARPVVAPGSARETAGDERKRSGFPLEISVEQVILENGVLTWRSGPEATIETLTDVDAVGSMTGPEGPFRIDLTGRYRGVPLRAAAVTGRLRDGQPLPLNIALDLADGRAKLALSAKADMAARRIDGMLDLTGPDAAAFAGLLAGRRVEQAPPLEFAVVSAVSASEKAFTLDGMEIRLGETRATGSLAASFADILDLRAAIRIKSLDLDSYFGKLPAGQGAAAPEPRKTAGKREFVLPDNVTGTVNFSADVVQWRGGLIRDAYFSATLGDGVLRVEKASAELPGGTTLTVNGQVLPAEGRFGFEGDLAATSHNLRAALDWLGQGGDSLPADRLRGFTWTSRIAVTPQAVSLTGITAGLDATRVTGGVTIARRERPSFGARLVIDRINLDNYFPQTAPDAGEKAGDGKNGAADQSGVAFMGAFDANFDITVADLVWRGVAVKRTHLDAQLFNNGLKIRSLTVGDLADAAISVTGGISNVHETPEASLDLSLGGRNTEAIFRLIGLPVRSLGRFGLTARVTGTAADLSLAGSLNAMNGRVSAEGRLYDLKNAPSWNFAVSVDHPDADRLLALALPARTPAGSGIGPLKAKFRLAGDAETLRVTELDASFAGSVVTGSADIVFAEPRTRIDAVLSADLVSMDRFIFKPDETGDGGDTAKRREGERWSSEKIDLSGLRKLDIGLAVEAGVLRRKDIQIERALLRAELVDGVLKLEGFSGAAFGGNFEFSGMLDAKSATPRMSGSFAGRELAIGPALKALADFDRLSGRASVDFSLSAAGDSERALVSSLEGAGEITGKARARLSKGERAQAGVAGIAGLILGENIAELGRAGDATGTLLRAFADAPADLSGDFVVARGRVRTENLTLRGDGAAAITEAVADLPAWTVDSTTTLRRAGDGDDPYMTVSLYGALDEPNVKSGGTWLRGSRQVRKETSASGKTSTNEAPAPEQKTDPPKPDQLFLDILKKLSQ